MKMIRTSVFFAALTICATLSAQVVKIPVGKKIKVSAESKGTMTMTAMGQEMEMATTNISDGEMEFVAATANGYTVQNTMKRLKVAVTSMGNTQTLDSDKPEDKNNPIYADAFKDLDKPVTVTVEDNKVKKTDAAKTSLNNLAENLSELTRLVLSGTDLSKLVPGYKWEDSTKVTEGFVIRTRYLVNKNDDKGIDVSAISDFQINTTISQMGTDAKTDFKGTGKAKRLYNKTTGILISEEADTDIAGELTVMDQLMPVSFKTKISTTVKE